MDTETAEKLLLTIRSIRFQLQTITLDLDAIERAVEDEVEGD